MFMTDAQMAKATFDYMKDGRFVPDRGLADNQIWRIGYMYAQVVRSYHGKITQEDFDDLHFYRLPEANERFDKERELYTTNLKYGVWGR